MGSACAQSDEEWTYTVRRGDNPWSITERLLDGMKYWPQIQSHNRIGDPQNIPPGTQLRIPIRWLRTESGAAEVLAASLGGCLLPDESGAERALRAGDKLPVGSVVRSAPGGNCTLGFPDRSRILLLEESELRIERIIAYAVTGMYDIATRLLHGRVETTAAPATGPASRFEINSPQGVTSVRGTVFRVASREATARAELLEGIIEVRNGAGQVSLGAGMGTVFTASAPPALPVPLLAAPSLADLPNQVRSAGPGLTFPAVPGAQGYRQQFAATGDFHLPLDDRRLTQPALVVPALAEGTYFLRVRAIDALGLEGHDATRPLRIEHLLPAPSDCSPAPDARIRSLAVTAQCRALPSARWYRVQFAQDTTFDSPQMDRLSTEPGMALQLERAGRYFWRMAAIDGSGRQGEYTSPMPLLRELEPPKLELAALDRDAMTFSWHPHRPDYRYRLQLSADRDFHTPLADQLTAGARLVLPRPAPGPCYARIGIIDAGEAGRGEPVFGPVHELTVPPVGTLDWLPPLGLLMLFLL